MAYHLPREVTLSELHLAWVSSVFKYRGTTDTSQTLNGSNAYAIFSAPRTSRIEAMVISTPWKSLTDGENFRGVAFVVSLAAFLKRS